MVALLDKRDVVFISSIDWSEKWQGPQEIATRLAGAGSRVLFVENTGVRVPRGSDAARVIRRLKNVARSVRQSVREVGPGIFICSPVVFPPFGSVFRRNLNRALLRMTVGRAIRRLGLLDPFIITALPTDTAREVIELARGKRSKVIYYMISDLVEMASEPECMIRCEEDLVRGADLVFVHYRGLMTRYRVDHDRVHEFPFGVNLERFTLEGEARQVPGSPDQPVIGYVGGMSQHLDARLIAQMALCRPDWSWVLIGPDEGSAHELAGLPNVHLVGHLPHDELPEWVRSFSVGMIPYKINDYTRTVLPTKVNEYLALGKPVVSSPLPSLEQRSEPGVLVISPNDASTFLSNIESLMAHSDDQLIRRRREIAEGQDWDTKVREMSKLILDA